MGFTPPCLAISATDGLPSHRECAHLGYEVQHQRCLLLLGQLCKAPREPRHQLPAGEQRQQRQGLDTVVAAPGDCRIPT